MTFYLWKMMWMYLQKVIAKNLRKIFFLLTSCRSLTKIAGSGFISQRFGFADPDPDPYQNFMDPQHWGRPMRMRILSDRETKKSLRRSRIILTLNSRFWTVSGGPHVEGERGGLFHSDNLHPLILLIFPFVLQRLWRQRLWRQRLWLQRLWRHHF